MGKSLILKDALGKPVGYIQQIQGVTRCMVRADAAEGDAQLWMFDERGHSRQVALHADGTEQTWRDEDALLGACVIVQGRCAAHTGEDARHMYMKRQPGQRALPCTAGETDAPAAPLHQATPSREERVLPQRRWPPLPCCPGAKYASGAWVLE